MADDLVLNLGTGGSTLATDEDASSRHYQIIKIADGTADSTTEIQAGAGTAANALRVELPTDGTGQVKLAAGTASVGTVILGTGTASIGKLAAGTAAIGVVEAAGSVAHDAAGTAIKPTLAGAIAKPTDGTAPGTAVAEDDLSHLKSDLDGRLLTNQAHPFLWKATTNTSSAQTDTELKAAPGASLSLYITDIVLSAVTAQTIKLVEDTASAVDVLEIMYLPANGTINLHFNTPMRLTANKNLGFTSTAAVAHSVYIAGYTAA